MPNTKGNSALIIVTIVVVLFVFSNYNTSSDNSTTDMSVWGWLTSLFSSKKTSTPQAVPQPQIAPMASSSCDAYKAYAQNLYVNYSKVYSDYASLQLKCERQRKDAQDVQNYLEKASAELVKTQKWITQCNDYRLPKCPSTSHTTRIECSGSMRPNFDCGFDIEVYKPLINDLRVCDVISFESPEGRTFHRVIGVEGARFTTKGDSTLTIDTYEPEYSDVVWKVCYN